MTDASGNLEAIEVALLLSMSTDDLAEDLRSHGLSNVRELLADLVDKRLVEGAVDRDDHDRIRAVRVGPPTELGWSVIANARATGHQNVTVGRDMVVSGAAVIGSSQATLSQAAAGTADLTSFLVAVTESLEVHHELIETANELLQELEGAAAAVASPSWRERYRMLLSQLAMGMGSSAVYDGLIAAGALASRHLP